MLTSAQIRSGFLDFFKSKGHQIVPSAPIVVKNDPTLLFTNAGMNQFKDYFLGNKTPSYRRVADTQKCLRVSGKHNDLEEVGVDTYHHTMFEMLGNWSFGDYFKKEAIAWSWELLTKVYQISPDRLYVTVFEGDAGEELPKDQESFDEWRTWLPEERILWGNKNDNFWEMGDTGPCGPCTEITIDNRDDETRRLLDARQLVNTGHPQVVEIWNNVFIQFNRLKDGRLETLPARHVDTGMGLERLVCVLQNKQSNYDTDLFTGLIDGIKTATGTRRNPSFRDPISKPSIAVRVVADHLRAIAFTIADGQLPSNTGAGYVIRRILRRAVRYYYSYLEYKQPLLFQLVEPLARQFEGVFPELNQQADFVSRVVREEEEAFLRTLDRGLRRIDDILSTATKSGPAARILEGASAFELFDTYGFPLDLTKLIAAEQGFSVDEAGFDLEMKKQKERSRAATTIDAGDWSVLIEDPLFEFVGYDSLEIKTKIARYRRVNIKGKEAFQLVLVATPFYAESGGQVGDTGWLRSADESIEIIDTKKENNLIVHFAQRLPRVLTEDFIATVDISKRKATAAHHSATHLLHAALREVLGKHVTQKGSLVNPEHLRFDFSHFQAVSPQQTRAIEQLINEKIRANIPVLVREMPKAEAMERGAMALFGEKYIDPVRVVMMDPSFSMELCGGTHVERTGEIGFFVITTETAVAAGVRRIEAKAGERAFSYLYDEILEPISKIKTLTKRKASELPQAVESLISENQDLKKTLQKQEDKQLTEKKLALLQKVEKIADAEVIAQSVEVSNSEALKKLSLELKNQLQRPAVLLLAVIDGRVHVALQLGESLANSRHLDASEIVKTHIAPLIAGKGGGQKFQAVASGQNLDSGARVLAVFRSTLGQPAGSSA